MTKEKQVSYNWHLKVVNQMIRDTKDKTLEDVEKLNRQSTKSSFLLIAKLDFKKLKNG